jgi:glycosyltransferase involved in cell wall biosynthesis
LKIIHIITKLELGGAQQNTLYTLEHLDGTEFDGMLVAGSEGLLVEEAGAAGRYETVLLPSLVREVRPLKDLRALAGLYRLLRGEVKKARESSTPLVVHTHSSTAGILGRAAAKLAGVPVVIHSVHGFGFHPYQSSPARRACVFLEKLAARWTTRFIAVSQADRERGAALGIFPPEKASLIRSGIPIGEFKGEGLDRAAKRESLGLGRDSRLVGMVACFKPQKNPVDFVRLAALVAREVDGVEFVLAGDGTLRSQVEQAVREHRLEERFHLLGWRRDVHEIIPLLDILVLTSLWEGLPRVFPQAMAAGRPIVAYRVDGAPEAVEEGVNGYLVDPGDFRAAAARVVGLLGDPAGASALGAAGAARVGQFDADRMVREQEELYRRLCPTISESALLAGP